MDLQIIKETEIPLLSRKRVTLEYSSQNNKTPVRKQLVKDIAKKLKAKEDTVAIRHIYTKFGNSISKVIAHIYKDNTLMNQYESKILMKKQAVEKAKAEEKTE